MRTQSTTITVADFCKGLARKEYIVNRDYQRSDTVWPPAARSFLIETILLDFPVPKMSLHQKLHVVSRTVHKEIVDGQQRSRAIRDFFEGKLRLTRANLSPDFQGRTLNELSDEAQAQFLNYGLNFDIFVNSRDEEVREVFRRMNSFTMPLNFEETRHATFQGPFKWFIHSLSREYDVAFQSAGVFSEKQINRMYDAKLLTEIVHAMENGFTTTTRASLTKIYKDNDVTFPEEEKLGAALRFGLDKLLMNGELHDTALMKSYNAYSLVLAYIHDSGMWTVEGDFVLPDVPEFEPDSPDYNLTLLAAALSKVDAAVDEDTPAEDALEDVEVPYAEFVKAAKDRTNVASQRQIRFEYFLAAIQR